MSKNKKIFLPTGSHVIDLSAASTEKMKRDDWREIRRNNWEKGRIPDCREHPGVRVDRFNWITSGRLLCKACIKQRKKKGKAKAIAARVLEGNR